MLKQCRERSKRSLPPNGGVSGMVDVSETKERFGPCDVEKCEVFPRWLGDDAGRPCAVFQELRDSSNGGAIDCVRNRFRTSGRRSLSIEIASNCVRL